jgi:signal transduction histidine kinase/CHASE2 domain-containing sensor protein
MLKLWNRCIRVDTLLLAALLICNTLLLAHQGLLAGFDQYVYDFLNRQFKQAATPDIVIISIDEDSLDNAGRWPWQGEHSEELLQQLKMLDVRSISFTYPYKPGIDRLSDSDNKHIDVMHKENLSSTPVKNIQHKNNKETNRQPGYLLTTSARPVRISLVQDNDGIVRSLYLTGKYAPDKWDDHYLILSGKTLSDPVMLDTATEADYPSVLAGKHRKISDRIYIPYRGMPGDYLRIPYQKIINGEVPWDVLRDKYVVVGVTSPGTGYRYPVPLGGFYNPMDDVEIVANILDAFISGTYIKPVETGWYLAYSGMFALIPFLLFTFYSPRMNVLVTILLATAVLGTSVLSYTIIHSWLPPSVALFAVVVSYLMWSSRRLQNAVNYLGKELVHLNAEIEGREVDFTSRLGTAFEFLDNILPLAGWYIADVEGNVKYINGHKPRLSNSVISPGTWMRDGNQFWTSIVENKKKLDIGLRWSTSAGPLPKEMTYLDGFLKQFSNTEDGKEHEAIEVVEKLITQVQKAIINLRNMHKFVDDCITQMADGLLVTNEIGKVLFANKRAAIYLQGHAINNLAGRDIFKLLDKLESSEAENTKGLLCRTYLEREPASINISNREGLELFLQITPLVCGKAGTGGVIITLSDISYLKAIERARNETISFVSHDLRSPLVSILALLELVKNCHSTEELQQLHKRIREYTQLTISMAEQFIQLARVESNTEIRMEVIDLVSTAINAYEQVWFQAQSKSIKLVRTIDMTHAWIKGESGLLERAIINLLNNAIKYSPEGRTVRMNLYSENGYICCAIEDQGYGIPEHELTSLFDRFHRAHGNSGVDEQGIGLGLALVKATVERHGGDIRVVSSEGNGTSFCLMIPEISICE